jgi:hypothetical protein
MAENIFDVLRAMGVGGKVHLTLTSGQQVQGTIHNIGVSPDSTIVIEDEDHHVLLRMSTIEALRYAKTARKPVVPKKSVSGTKNIAPKISYSEGDIKILMEEFQRQVTQHVGSVITGEYNLEELPLGSESGLALILMQAADVIGALAKERRDDVAGAVKTIKFGYHRNWDVAFGNSVLTIFAPLDLGDTGLPKDDDLKDRINRLI